jgi:hypothetical protein
MAQTSAGTYTYVIINASSGACGTCTSTLQPHPTYSDLTGGTVVQLQAVTLGGFNGLNN